MPSDVDCAYAAGFIDADGCIQLHKSKHKMYMHGYRFSPYVMATGIDVGPLQWIRDTFQMGSIQMKNHRITRSNIKNKYQVYMWVCTHKNSLEFCRLIRPFLKIKHHQCDRIISFYDEALWTKANLGRRSLPKEEMDRRETLANEVRFYNQRRYLEILDYEP